MTTHAEMFERLQNWHFWSGADISAREAEVEGRCATAAEYRARRDQRTVDPLQVLATTRDLIESLNAGRWDVITEARLRGATWEQVAAAMSRRADEVEAEYSAMVGWIADARPEFIDLGRYRAALESHQG